MSFIRLRQNTLQLAAEMNGGANVPKLEQRKGGLASANSTLIPRSLLRGGLLDQQYQLLTFPPCVIGHI